MDDLRSFLQRAKQPRYTIPERVRTHPTEASAVPPDTTLSPRPFPSGPTALGLRSFPPRPTRPPPRTPGKSASPGKSAGQENPPARNIVRPGNPPQPGNPPARPSFHPAPVLSGFVPLRSPSPARFTPLSPRRNTCRASPLPPNGMPHEPRRGRPVQICRPDRMPRQKERQPAGAAALRQSDSGPIICC